MAWTTPGTATAGDVLTASFLNASVLRNLDAVGLIHLKTFTATAATSPLSVTSVFSSAYSNYRVVIYMAPSTSIGCTLRLLNSVGTQITDANYAYSNVRTDSSGGSSFVNDSNGRNQTSAALITTSRQFVLSLDFYSPNLVLPTIITGTGSMALGNNYSFSASLDLTTQATGFDFILSTGNVTGTISVYGYTK
jgi:hypothetical protein